MTNAPARKVRLYSLLAQSPVFLPFQPKQVNILPVEPIHTLLVFHILYPLERVDSRQVRVFPLSHELAVDCMLLGSQLMGFSSQRPLRISQALLVLVFIDRYKVRIPLNRTLMLF